MAGCLNRAQVLGYLGRDPESRSTHDGRLIVTLSLATTESWTDKQSGDKRESTEWHKIVIFNEGLAKVAEQYLRKGARVLIEGKLQTRKWTDSSNVERWTTEIVMQGWGSSMIMLGDRSGAPAVAPSGNGQAPTEQAGRAGGTEHALDDEIPF